MILIQGLIAFIQIRAAGGTVTLGGFAAGLGLLFLNLLYYYSLTLMLGALFHSRGPVIGIPLAVVFGYQLVLGLAPWLGQIMPWALTNMAGVNAVPLTVAAALGMPLETPWPIVGTLVGCVVFVAVALWRFEREEF
jgi:ABC-2 type transport system permease protein